MHSPYTFRKENMLNPLKIVDEIKMDLDAGDSIKMALLGQIALHAENVGDFIGRPFLKLSRWANNEWWKERKKRRESSDS